MHQYRMLYYANYLCAFGFVSLSVYKRNTYTYTYRVYVYIIYYTSSNAQSAETLISVPYINHHAITNIIYFIHAYNIFTYIHRYINTYIYIHISIYIYMFA